MVLDENLKDTMDSKTNTRVMEVSGQSRSLVNRIRIQHAVFVLHIMRREVLYMYM